MVHYHHNNTYNKLGCPLQHYYIDDLEGYLDVIDENSVTNHLVEFCPIWPYIWKRTWSGRFSPIQDGVSCKTSGTAPLFSPNTIHCKN